MQPLQKGGSWNKAFNIIHHASAQANNGNNVLLVVELVLYHIVLLLSGSKTLLVINSSRLTFQNFLCHCSKLRCDKCTQRNEATKLCFDSILVQHTQFFKEQHDPIDNSP